MNPSNTPLSDSEPSHDRMPPEQPGWLHQSFTPFRIATLRGLAVALPPLLTIVFFVWAWNAVDRAVFHPLELLARQTVAWMIDDTLTDAEVQKQIQETENGERRLKKVGGETVYTSPTGRTYVKIQSSWIPQEIVASVRANPGEAHVKSASAYYPRYVESRFLKRYLLIPAFLALFLVVMYLIGKVFAAGIGRILYLFAETLIDRVPIIRNVYSSVKQVTDFVFTDTEVQFTRVVAVEYPRKGIWSMGFVTGDSMLDIREAAGEPMLSVLMPTSPMPATGFTISIPKSETIDLNITMDQAIQFCVSCGVVVPSSQMPKNRMENEIRKRITRGGTTDRMTETPPPSPSPEDAASQGTSPEGTSSQDASPEDASPEDASSQDATPQDDSQKNVSPEEHDSTQD